MRNNVFGPLSDEDEDNLRQRRSNNSFYNKQTVNNILLKMNATNKSQVFYINPIKHFNFK